jgi:hypothetical protein
MFAVRSDNYLHYSREGDVNTKSTLGDAMIAYGTPQKPKATLGALMSWIFRKSVRQTCKRSHRALPNLCLLRALSCGAATPRVD